MTHQLVANDVDLIRARESFLSAFGGLDAKRPTAWAQYGYRESLTFPDFKQAYDRGGAAHGAVHRLLDGCWQKLPRIKQPAADKETAWETKVGKALKSINAWQKLRDLDRRNLIGRYAALIYRMADIDETSQSKKAYIRLSVSTGEVVEIEAANPKKVKLSACTTYSQAMNRAQLEARRLLYQRVSVTDTAMNDAGSLGIGSLVRWIDPNDFAGDDGLQAGEVLAISGNFIRTSEPLDWKGEIEGRILLTGADGQYLGAPVICFPAGAMVELATVPAGAYVAGGDRQLGSRYAFAVGLTDAEVESSSLFLTTSIKPDSAANCVLALAEYDARIYGFDG